MGNDWRIGIRCQLKASWGTFPGMIGRYWWDIRRISTKKGVTLMRFAILVLNPIVKFGQFTSLKSVVQNQGSELLGATTAEPEEILATVEQNTIEIHSLCCSCRLRIGIHI